MVRIAATLMLAASTKALTRASFNRLTPTALLGSLLGANGDKYAGAVMGTEDIMKPKAHGACPALEGKAPSDSGGCGDGVHRGAHHSTCLLYTSPSPRDGLLSRMPSSA